MSSSGKVKSLMIAGLLLSQSPCMKYLTKGCSNHCGLLACSWVKMAEFVVQQGSEHKVPVIIYAIA